MQEDTLQKGDVAGKNIARKIEIREVLG